MTPFQAKSDRPRLLGFDSITNGLKDAGHLWLEIATRILFRLGYLRSSCDPMLFIKHAGEQGLALVEKLAGDDLKTFSRDKEGRVMVAELEAAEAKAGWVMKRRSLDEEPDGSRNSTTGRERGQGWPSANPSSLSG
jgi:hypothetical protein